MKVFDGTGEISVWLKKVKLVARIKGIKDLSLFIPLYLEGDAFAVYDQMSDSDKKDEDRIEKVLLDAFGINLFSAYDLFRQRNYVPSESVDVYLSDLRRLAGLADVLSENLIRCAFICGLPSDVSCQLRAQVRIEGSSLSEILEQTRILLDERLNSRGYDGITFEVRQLLKENECRQMTELNRGTGQHCLLFSSDQKICPKI